jgi:hypothetical protein
VLDLEAVNDARSALGIKAPVAILIRAYTHLDGRYIGFKGGAHRIGIDRDLPARVASRVVWHELTHASQVERLGSLGDWAARWDGEMKALGLTKQQSSRASARRYNRAPLEREARANERRFRRFRLTQKSSRVER